MQSATDIIIRATPATRAETLRRVGEIHRDRFPDLVLMIEDNGTILRWPQNSAVQFPAGSAGNVSGVGTQGEHYFAWAPGGQVGTDGISCTPHPDRYLSWMLP